MIARAARSEAEHAEREAAQMRPCTPTPSAPSATGRQLGESQKSIACPKASPNRRLQRYADPRRAEGHCTGARQAPFSFGPCTAHILFGQDRKEYGGCILAGPALLAGASPPWPPFGGPKFTPAVDHRPTPPPWPAGLSPGPGPRRGRGGPAWCPPPRCWSRRRSGRTSW